jgi:hypothetical protein
VLADITRDSEKTKQDERNLSALLVLTRNEVNWFVILPHAMHGNTLLKEVCTAIALKFGV